MESDVAQILLSTERIQSRVREMAGEIASTYESSREGLTLVPILAGSLIFLADLMRELPLKMKIGLVHASTYRGASTTPGECEILLPPSADLAGRDVLLIDDILDSGRTLRAVTEQLRALGPASVRTAVLLRKPNRKPADLDADFVGFDVGDDFVVGYGLDYNNYYRNLPFVGVLRHELVQ